MTHLYFDSHGFPTLIAGGDIPDNAIELAETEAVNILAAIAKGDTVASDGSGGWTITEKPPLSIEQVRAITKIDRSVFCNRLADHSVLTDAEAISAAKGEWPSAMLFFIGFLTPKQQRDAQITWASCATVERNHWLVLAMISMSVVTEAVADAVFGIDV